MNRDNLEDMQMEAALNELVPGPLHSFSVNRRDFFTHLGSGIVVALVLSEVLAAQESGQERRRPGGSALPQELGAWLHIGEDGHVTVFTGKAEMGQNIRTSLTQAVVEELRLPVDSVKLVMADTDLTPFDMGTFGSLTTPTMAPQLHRASAAARELLIDLAAERWKADRKAITVADGNVILSSGNQTASFGELTRGQKLVKTIAAEAPLTPASEWRVAGKTLPKIDGRAMVTGGHRYASDMKRPGMLMGKVLRPPAFHSQPASVDASKARGMPGVTVVQDGEFIAVAAPDAAQASAAIASIQVDWSTTPQPSSKEIFTFLKNNATPGRGGEGGPGQSRGSLESGMAEADKKHAATYTIAYIAHAPLEPRAAVAEWHEGKLTVWTGSQRPFGVRGELAQAFHLPEEKIRVIVPDTGSGYGGKHTGDAAIEAARIARAAGKPVKVVWTREEEFTWAYFRPAGVIEASSGVKADGTITAWEFHNYNSGPAAIAPLFYDFPNQKIEFHPAASPLRQGFYRGLAATANHFARESQISELADLVGLDPVEFRLKNTKNPRSRAVLEAAAERFGWGKSKPAQGHGFGVAAGFEKGGYVAACAEVAADRASESIRVIRVVEAFECGAVVNPDHLKNQIEGSIVQALGGALLESIEFENGKILNCRFSEYHVPHFSHVPAIEVVLLDRKDLPSAGAGETPIVAPGPAIAAAVFQASGIRLRSLPMRL
jgi:isoquinoline 1-oxidoreductase